MIPDDDFASEISEVDGVLGVKVTVRRLSTEETQSVILLPESWEDTRREYAIYIAIGRLKQQMGWKFPIPDFTAELVEHRYFCGPEAGCISVIAHKPSGITSRLFRPHSATGAERLREQNRWIEEFFLLLWEAGIRPQPRKESVKRSGKPRWGEEQRFQESSDITQGEG